MKKAIVGKHIIINRLAKVDGVFFRVIVKSDEGKLDYKIDFSKETDAILYGIKRAWTFGKFEKEV